MSKALNAMDRYCLIQDSSEFTITQNGNVFWKGNLTTTIKSFGFLSKDAKGNSYELKARGMFFWKKLELYMNNECVDSYKLYKSELSGVYLDSKGFVNGKDNGYICSIERERTKVDSGLALFNWECDDESIQTQIISCIILRLQNSGYPYGSAVGI